MALEVPQNFRHNRRMLNQDRVEFGDAVDWKGDIMMVIGKTEDGYLEVVPYPEAAYQVKLEDLTEAE